MGRQARNYVMANHDYRALASRFRGHHSTPAGAIREAVAILKWIGWLSGMKDESD